MTRLRDSILGLALLLTSGCVSLSPRFSVPLSEAAHVEHLPGVSSRDRAEALRLIDLGERAYHARYGRRPLVLGIVLHPGRHLVGLPRVRGRAYFATRRIHLPARNATAILHELRHLDLARPGHDSTFHTCNQIGALLPFVGDDQ